MSQNTSTEAAQSLPCPTELRKLNGNNETSVPKFATPLVKANHRCGGASKPTVEQSPLRLFKGKSAAFVPPIRSSNRSAAQASSLNIRQTTTQPGSSADAAACVDDTDRDDATSSSMIVTSKAPHSVSSASVFRTPLAPNDSTNRRQNNVTFSETTVNRLAGGAIPRVGPTSVSTSSGSARSAKYKNSTRNNSSTSSSGAGNQTSQATPGTQASGRVSQVLMSVVEGRGLAKGEVGVAWLDLSHPELQLSQFSETTTYSRLRIKLHILNPVEIIMPDSSVEGSGNMLSLYQLLEEEFPNTSLTKVARRRFNENCGLQTIKHLRLPELSSLDKDLNNKYYCLSAAAALIAHVEDIQCMVFAAGSLKIVYTGLDQTCLIDPNTAKQLELIVALRDIKNTEVSLYGVLNRTYTICGARLLRASVLQPLTDVAAIESRLDAVEELLNSDSVMFSLKSVISRMLDIQNAIGLVIKIDQNETLRAADFKISQVITLKHTLGLVEALQTNLKKLNCDVFKRYAKILEDDGFDKIINLIHAVVDEDAKFQKGSLNQRIQKCFAVRNKLHGLLDITRRTYIELMDDLTEMCQNIQQTTEIPFELSYRVNRGFFLSLTVKGKDKLPQKLDPQFISVNYWGNTLTCTTRALLMINDRINKVDSEIVMMSNVVMTELLENIRGHVACLYNLSECIGTLDVIMSLASACTVGDYVRPTFGDAIAIKQGRHPILERLPDKVAIPNDTVLLLWKLLKF